jgi:hypothetical protein
MDKRLCDRALPCLSLFSMNFANSFFMVAGEIDVRVALSATSTKESRAEKLLRAGIKGGCNGARRERLLPLFAIGQMHPCCHFGSIAIYMETKPECRASLNVSWE